MASTVARITTEDRSSFWDFKGKEPIIDSWPLMRSPVPVVLILSAYFLMVMLGPKWMKKKPAMNLDKTLMFYNALQVIASVTLCYKIHEYGIFRNGFLLGGCHFPVDSTNLYPDIYLGTWAYLCMKIVELLDTVFFVLRKKNNQITPLHVFHHSTMVLYMWSYTKYGVAGDGAVLAFLNCIVHAVMYTYYFLSGLGPRFQKYLWWKKYVTELQLIQFLLMLTYLVWTYFSPRCKFSTFFTGFIVFNVTIYLIMFLDFYYKSYKNKKNNAKKTVYCK